MRKRGRRSPYLEARRLPSTAAPLKKPNRSPIAWAPPPVSSAQTGTSTAAYAVSSRLVNATISVMASSTGSRRRKRPPSRRSAR